jgi:hypothetical protein
MGKGNKMEREKALMDFSGDEILHVTFIPVSLPNLLILSGRSFWQAQLDIMQRYNRSSNDGSPISISKHRNLQNVPKKLKFQS